MANIAGVSHDTRYLSCVWARFFLRPCCHIEDRRILGAGRFESTTARAYCRRAETVSRAASVREVAFGSSAASPLLLTQRTFGMGKS